MDYLLNNSQEEVRKAISWVIKQGDRFKIDAENLQLMDGSGHLFIRDSAYGDHWWVTPYMHKLDCPDEDAGPDGGNLHEIWIGYDGGDYVPVRFDGTALSYEKFWLRWCYLATAAIREYRKQQTRQTLEVTK